MKIHFITATALLFNLLSIACSSADIATDIETGLNNAKNHGIPVVIEIASKTCLSCADMEPVLKKIAHEYKGRLDIIFIFIDLPGQKDIALKFGFRAIPTQIFLDKNGKEFSRHVGIFSYKDIKTVLKQTGLY